jgi:hypothetical protein
MVIYKVLTQEEFFQTLNIIKNGDTIIFNQILLDMEEK